MNARSEILSAIRRLPAVTKTRICEETGLSWGTVDYHVKHLRSRGQVRMYQNGKYTLLMPTGGSLGLAPHALHTLRSAMEVGVVVALAVPCSISVMARRLGISRRIAVRHLRALQDAGLVTMRRSWPPDYMLTSKALRAIYLIAGADQDETTRDPDGPMDTLAQDATTPRHDHQGMPSPP